VTISIIQFSPKKAVAALAYLINGATTDMYVLLKMLYVADKKHLAKSGRFMAGDKYVAMPKGATPSGTYDLVKFVRGDGDSHFGFPEIRDILTVDPETHQIELLSDVPEQHLSRAAKECLDEVIDKYRENPSLGYWFKAAHDSAWTKTKVRHPIDGAPQISGVAIASTIPDSDELQDYLQEAG